MYVFPNDPQIWVIPMSADAYFAALELDANCERCGLDVYLQAQIMFQAASGAKKTALWEQVWDYVQAMTYSQITEPKFIVIDGGSQVRRF